MAGVKEYKCPSCGGVLEFDSTLQKMKCPYCGTELEVEALEAYDAHLNDETPDDMTWDSVQGIDWDEEETAGLRTYICESCGGEIMTDESTAASNCPFCGNPVVMMNQFSGQLKPDYVIPFKLDKEAAKEFGFVYDMDLRMRGIKPFWHGGITYDEDIPDPRRVLFHRP